MLKNKRYSFRVFLAIVFGLSIGISIPLIFAIIDLNQLGNRITSSNLMLFITTQDLYKYSLFFFPSVFSIIAVLLVVLDFKNKKLIEVYNKLTEEQAHLAQSSKMASLGLLAAGIGHEINNPLAVIKGNLELMKKNFEQLQIKADNLIYKRHQSCIVSVEKITKIVSAIKSIARTSTDKMFETVDAHNAIQSTCGLIEELFLQQSIKVNLELKAMNYFFVGDYNKIQQVILNLLTNSRDALGECAVDRNIFIRTYNLGQLLVIELEDNGNGIPSEHLDKVFDKFFTTKDVDKGTGLGLSLCQGFIRDMGGEITVSSTIGRGSTFKISLTSSALAPNQTNLGKDGLCLKLDQAKDTFSFFADSNVLVVDDDVLLSEVLCEMLESKGVKFKATFNGIEAWEELNKNRYDLIITDLKMPKMSGEELLEKIKLSQFNNIPVIVLSGGTESEFTSKNELIKTQAMSYLSKPYDEDELLMVISRLLECKHSKGD